MPRAPHAACFRHASTRLYKWSGMGPFARLVICVAAAVGTAFAVAVAVAIIDLYLTGHGYGSITRESTSEPSWGGAQKHRRHRPAGRRGGGHSHLVAAAAQTRVVTDGRTIFHGGPSRATPVCAAA